MMSLTYKNEKKDNYLLGVVANSNGDIFEIEGYAAVGMSGKQLVPLFEKDTIKMPHGGELMLLPGRFPILYDIANREFITLDVNPYNPKEEIFPVAAFNSPGYVISHNAAYEEGEGTEALPLFSYGAVGWSCGEFKTAVILIDKERRQDLRLMPISKVKQGVNKMRKIYPKNRLMRHLENCALSYGCPAAKNFYIGRCEAPIPTSRNCNAKCLGCISFQSDKTVSNCQERISFTPSSTEIAEVALEHINKVEKSIVSFGQGCEGDPLMAYSVIEPGIRLIRSKTDSGTINMNTNASIPDKIKKLFDAGLDTIRVSMNSVRTECYNAYFRPVNYSFSDVKKSIKIANSKNKIVALNYLNCPGITDSVEEFNALVEFLKKHTVHLIQWRNLNIDPVWYFSKMNQVSKQTEPMGMQNIINYLTKLFPDLRHGYFNPSKLSFSVALPIHT